MNIIDNGSGSWALSLTRLVLVLNLCAAAAFAQTVTHQVTSLLTDSGSDAPLPAIADAQPDPDAVTPPLNVSVPNSQAPRLLNLINPAIAIPFGSGIRELDARWNGSALPLIDPTGTELVDDAHSYGSAIGFFKPLFSVASVPVGKGTLEITGYDSNHVQVASVTVSNLVVVNPPVPIASSALAAIPHPRIYLTAQRLAAIHARPPGDVARDRYEGALARFLEALASSPNVLSTDFPVDDPESYIPHLALTYQLRELADPGTAALAAGAAHTLVTNLATAYATGQRSFGGDKGYEIRFGLRNLMLAYDWMYDQFSTGERSLIVNVATNWVYWYHTNSGYAETRPVENYYAGYLQGIALTAVGTAGDTPYTESLLSLLRHKLGNEVPLMNQKLAGGDWAEGWNYGPYSVTEFSLVNTLLNDFGEDWSPDFDWLQTLPRSLMYMTAPDFSQTRSYGGYSANYPNKTSPAMLAVLSSTTIDGPYASYLYSAMNDSPNNDFADAPANTFYEMIFATTNSSPDLAAQSLSYFNSGTGRWFSRSSLIEPDAYFVSAENISYSYDHYGYSNGDVRLYHGHDCLVCPSAYRGPDFDGEALTSAFSTYRVNSTDQGYEQSHNNQNLFVTERGAYAAIGMRFESSWPTNRYDEGVVNASNPLDYMIREAVHLRPGTLIVRDLHRRRHAADTLTASFHLGLTNAVQKAAFGYQVAGLRISVLYPAEVDVSFRPDTDASTNIIGSVMHLDFASSTTPMELITVFSESLTINSYANRVLKLSDGTKLTFGINGPLSVVLTGTDLAIQRSGGSVILDWSNANSVLQSSRVVDGPFQDVFGAKSPYSYSILSNAQFFRLSEN